ncbi:putative holliday junction resolvase [Escherichia coli]|uniref:Putative holliday junction resolvase n=1 Tax=Escherichia coli TaxID=562 RepID=A0A377DLX3_ECOLX|nr:putative holliday junction resolvase [Escherichia coli]
MSGTLLAFDFGTKSIGVAVGQRITGTARPLPAIKSTGRYAGLEHYRAFTERVAAGRNHRRFAAEYGRHRATIDCQSA